MADNFKAFVEASAGSAGSLFSLACLYPIDITKTRIQAKDSDDKSPTSFSGVLKEIYEEKGLLGLFTGFETKGLATVVSNFAYFYLYSFLKSFYERRYGKLTTTTNLGVATMAAALNVTFTLPLDVLSTRVQTSKGNVSMLGVARELMKEGGFSAFWKGYVASLVLCSNPAINYTVFDRLKLQLQVIRMRKAGTSRLSPLSVMQAFWLAAVAKSLATILTYPMIRVKVLMMARKKQLKLNNGNVEADHPNEESRGAGVLEVSSDLLRSQGVSGFFSGCSAQVWSGVLKSALLLVSKEQIETQTKGALFALKKMRDTKQ